jgi:hypothetical protein
MNGCEWLYTTHKTMIYSRLCVSSINIVRNDNLLDQNGVKETDKTHLEIKWWDQNNQDMRLTHRQRRKERSSSILTAVAPFKGRKEKWAFSSN